LPTKYVANRKAWVTQAIFTDYLRALDAKMSSQNRKILLFLDQCAAHPQDTCYLKNVKVVFFRPNCTSSLQPPDQGIIGSFKHYNCRHLVRKTIYMIDHKLLRDATLMKLNVLDALQFISESWRCVTQMTIVNCFQKCGFNLNQANNGEDVREISIAENDWSVLKAGVSFQEYVSCDDNVVRCEVQTLEQMIDEKLTCGVSKEEDDGGKGEPPATFLCALEGIDTVRKYLMKFDVDDNTMASLSSIENEVYRFQQKAKKQQLTLMDMWKK
jgi:hypothetical protein